MATRYRSRADLFSSSLDPPVSSSVHPLRNTYVSPLPHCLRSTPQMGLLVPPAARTRQQKR